MDSWKPSFLSAKKLLVSFSLVCFVLSIPLFYLLYANNIDFKERYQSTLLEINGNHLIGALLEDFSLLGHSDHLSLVEFERGKKEIQEKLMTKNVLNLTTDQLREAETFFYEWKNSSNQALARDYYEPLIRFVANHSNLILDPDLDSYYFMDILALRLPRIYLFLANDRGSEVMNKKLLEELQTEFIEINYSLKTAIIESEKRSNKSRQNFPHMSNFFAITDEIDSQLNGRKKINTEEIIQKLQIFEKDIIENLDGSLLNRNQEIKKNRDFVLMATLGFWLLGIISGYFLFVKILKDHAEMLKRYVDQSIKLEESEKLSFVGEIASSIAHEVRNPLTIIDFEAATVRKNLNSEQFDKERAFQRLTKISEMSSRINKISNLITMFTRKSLKEPFECVPFKKILEDTLYLTQLKSSKLEIPIHVTPLECDVCCRTIELEQVFINLVNNAIDAIEPLSERWVKIVPTLTEKEGEEWIVVRIVDSGTGIKKEVVDHMFSSFFTTKPSGKGTGLGLSVAQRIVEDHRGKFYYAKNEEHTTFVVEIPRVQPLI